MSHRNSSAQVGFTLVELTVVIVLTGLIIVTAYTFFNTSFFQYLSLQKEGSSFSDLAVQTQRIATVLRGLTAVTAASNDDITCYAYFSPSDAYVSQIHYYKNVGNTQLLADVTRMSSDPPIGMLLPATKKTYVIIPVFYQATNVKTFVYLDAAGAPLTIPIADLRTIKGMQVTLAVPDGNLSKNSSQTISLQVSLRNLKVNL